VAGDLIRCSGFSKAAFLNNQTLTVLVATGTTLTATFVGSNYASTVETGQIVWMPGHSLLGFVLDSTTTPVTGSPESIALSPNRTGDSFGSVSAVSPDGAAIEIYFESHPKQLTFQDQIFKIQKFTRSSGLVWDAQPTVLFSFTGRHADNRLTVAMHGTQRFLSQVFFNQLTEPSKLVGNVLFGYQSTVGAAWKFNVTPGSAVSGSLTQCTLSVSSSQGVRIAYLLQDLGDMSTTTWPLHVATVDLNTLNITDVAGFYNNLRFTWLRGTKSVVDDTSLWMVVGERQTNATATPVFLSNFNVPPVAVLQPSSVTIHRAQPLTLSASQTSDGDVDALAFTWLENDPDITNVVLTPNGSSANLVVGRAVGGAARTFVTAVVAVDSKNNTPLHPAQSITNVSLTSNTVTVTVSNNYVAGQQVLVFGLQTATWLNGKVLTVVSGNGINFTASFTHANYSSTADTGFVIASPQFAISNITVPLNNAPTIDFTHDAISHQSVTVPISAARNSLVTINPTLTGVADVDDLPSYSWTQSQGTPVTIIGTLDKSSLSFLTNGVNVNGEALQFQFTVDDGVNTPITSTVEIDVAAYDFSGLDTHKLARSIWTSLAAITNVAITANVLTITAVNNFFVGQKVFLTGLTSPASLFLNNQTVTILSLTPTQFTAAFTHANYASAPETGVASVSTGIAKRNTANTWSPLAPSTMFTDMSDIKRTSVIDGTDRYICISKGSVQVLGGINPTLVLLRKLLTPGALPILDAVHTEDDWTLVLDANGKLYRYITAPLINTDNPEDTIVLASYSALSFTKLYSIPSHGNVRVILLTGKSGGLLLQVRNSDLQIQGAMELTGASGFVYGSNNIQWVRTSNVESLRTGKILLGSVATNIANISSINITANALTVVCANNFIAGEVVTIAGLTHATFLNGMVVQVVSATSTQFLASFTHADYATTNDTGTVSTPGKTYETLIDLVHGQIIGTWDASNLHNIIVHSGEILFEPNSGYSGRTQFPTQNPIQFLGTDVLLSWIQPRPDLVTSYNIQISSDGANSWERFATVNSGAVQQYKTPLQSGATYAFRVQAISPDGPSIFSNIEWVYVGLLNPPTIDAITQVTASGPNYILTVNWTAHNPDAAAVSSYELQMKTDSGTFNTVMTGASTTYIAPALASNHTYSFQIRARVAVQDSYTAYSVPAAITLPLVEVTQSLLAGVHNVAYNASLVATGGVTPYVWSINGGSLPTGLVLDPAGTISGTTASTGTFNFNLRVTDSALPTSFHQQTAISLVVS
jgi:hypothetical protein